MMETWAEIYLWETDYDGVTVRQADEDIDQNAGVEQNGQAFEIRLCPQNVMFKRISIPIPEGATPVYFRRNRITVGCEGESMSFCIGWSMDGTRFLLAVDSATGDVTQLIE